MVVMNDRHLLPKPPPYGSEADEAGTEKEKSGRDRHGGTGRQMIEAEP